MRKSVRHSSFVTRPFISLLNHSLLIAGPLVQNAPHGMSERPLGRLYLPWLSWLLLGLIAIAAVVIISLAAVLISSHEFGRLMKLLGVTLVLLVTSSVLLVKFRQRFDQYIQSDGETFLHFWSPKRQLTIERSDISSITLTDRRIVVESPDGSISIDRRYPEFESLKRVMERWRS